jgi:hypothetical protein
MRALRIIAFMVVVAAVTTWWRWPRDASVATPAAAAVPPAPVAAPRPPETQVATPAAVPVAPAITKIAGALKFSGSGGSGESLELQVAGGIALWNPAEHRLRVLLTDEPLDPAREQQMLGYLRDERLADSGRAYGVLDLQFRPEASTLDRAALTSAALTVAAPGGVAHDTADVLSSIHWTGRVQPSSGGGAATARPQLEFTAAGNARSTDANPRQQNWQLSIAVPVAQMSEP